MTRLRGGVIGAGYLGRFHVEKYDTLDNVELVGVVDTDEETARDIAGRFGVKSFTDHRDLLPKIDVVSIAVPTEHHYRIARDCLDAGVHVLLEKPVTQTVEEAEDLVRRADSNGLVFQVGHLERFNPAIIALKGVLTKPLFIESHRLSQFRPRGTDVNVILDLMIHDIDIILNMVPGELTAVRPMGFPVLTDGCDIANVRLEFSNGCVANVTASRVSHTFMRKMRVFQHDAYISIDYQDHTISIFRKDPELLDEHGHSRINVEEKKFEKTDALMQETAAFVDSVINGTPPVVSGEDGKRALQVALDITVKIKAHLVSVLGYDPGLAR